MKLHFAITGLIALVLLLTCNNSMQPEVSNGKFISRIWENGIIHETYMYNSSHQVTRIDHYDSAGIPESYSEYFYSNGRKLINSQTVWIQSGETTTCNYSYDSSDRIATMEKTTAGTQRSVLSTVYQYDSLNQPAQIRQYLNDQLSYTYTNTFTGHNQVESIVKLHGTVTTHYRYQFDTGNNPLQNISTHFNANRNNVAKVINVLRNNSEDIVNRYEYNADGYPVRATSFFANGMNRVTTIEYIEQEPQHM